MPELNLNEPHVLDLTDDCRAVVLTSGIPVGGEREHGKNAVNDLIPFYGTQESRNRRKDPKGVLEEPLLSHP
jgi:hypothetical protein